MNETRASWKHLAVRLLPDGIQTRLKRIYYPRLIKNFPEDRWPGSAVVRRLVAPGDSVVDAGANIGYVAAMLSRWVGPTGLVHSFEPVPETCDLLLHNVKTLRLSNVVVHRCALSSGSRTAQMVIPEYPGGGKNIYESKIVETSDSARGSVRVETKALDSVFTADVSRPVTFMKIDVEGHELDVLQGGASMLRRDRPALYIEISGDLDDDASRTGQLVRFLRELGYSSYLADGENVRVRARGDQSVDYFFLQTTHLGLVTQL